MAESDHTGTVTELLSEDHRRLDTLLAEAKAATSARDLARARARFVAFRAGLERHIEAEEQVLFPAIERLSDVAVGPTGVMRQEHLELRRLMEEVAASFDAGGRLGLSTPLAALTARIYAHNGKEERILYPLSDRIALEAGVLEDLACRLRRLRHRALRP